MYAIRSKTHYNFQNHDVDCLMIRIAKETLEKITCWLTFLSQGMPLLGHFGAISDNFVGHTTNQILANGSHSEPFVLCSRFGLNRHLWGILEQLEIIFFRSFGYCCMVGLLRGSENGFGPFWARVEMVLTLSHLFLLAVLAKISLFGAFWSKSR